jgi:GNAT superfamily N-acetyltransferase
MTFDPVLSLRIVNLNRLPGGEEIGEYRDLGGALARISELATPWANRLEGFSTDDRHVEGLLDVGFSLLRAFDYAPAVLVTPVDRPESLAERLRARGLSAEDRQVAMVFRGDERSIPRHASLAIKKVDAESAAAFAATRAAGFGFTAPMRRFFLKATYAAVLDADTTYYLGSIDGEPVATAILRSDGGTAGIWGVSTLKPHRKRGTATAMLARAIGDARRDGCDVVSLHTEAEGEPRRLYDRLGFEAVHETELWVGH